MQVPSFAGIIIDIIVGLTLVLSFIGGLKRGAPRELFGLVAFLVALLLVGAFVVYVNVWLAFVPENLWRAFLTFLLTMAIILIVMSLVLLIPRHLLESVWNGGFVWSMLGGIFALLNNALGLATTLVVLDIYPVMPWLDDWLATSCILNWLLSSLGPTVLTILHATLAY